MNGSSLPAQPDAVHIHVRNDTGSDVVETENGVAHDIDAGAGLG